jgi:hypothetical protein
MNEQETPLNIKMMVTIEKSEYDTLVAFKEMVMSGKIRVIYGTGDNPIGFIHPANIEGICKIFKFKYPNE